MNVELFQKCWSRCANCCTICWPGHTYSILAGSACSPLEVLLATAGCARCPYHVTLSARPLSVWKYFRLQLCIAVLLSDRVTDLLCGDCGQLVLYTVQLDKSDNSGYLRVHAQQQPAGHTLSTREWRVCVVRLEHWAVFISVSPELVCVHADVPKTTMAHNLLAPSLSCVVIGAR